MKSFENNLVGCCSSLSEVGLFFWYKPPVQALGWDMSNITNVRVKDASLNESADCQDRKQITGSVHTLYGGRTQYY